MISKLRYWIALHVGLPVFRLFGYDVKTHETEDGKLYIDIKTPRGRTLVDMEYKEAVNINIDSTDAKSAQMVVEMIGKTFEDAIKDDTIHAK